MFLRAIWTVVKTMVLFGVPIIIRHLVWNLNFDSYPYIGFGSYMQLGFSQFIQCSQRFNTRS